MRRALLLAAALVAAAPALAQQRGAPSRAAAPKAADKPAEKPAEPADAPAPYDRDLLRLSEVIGAMAFLRALCAAPDAAQWPARMKTLIDSEGAASAARRDRLAGAYNRGYRGYALTYRACTPSAREAAALYAAEGDRLSHALAGRFGG